MIFYIVIIDCMSYLFFNYFLFYFFSPFISISVSIAYSEYEIYLVFQSISIRSNNKPESKPSKYIDNFILNSN